VKSGKIHGLKSHDYQIIMERLLSLHVILIIAAYLANWESFFH
jgi:hypothetical protein